MGARGKERVGKEKDGRQEKEREWKARQEGKGQRVYRVARDLDSKLHFYLCWAGNVFVAVCLCVSVCLCVCACLYVLHMMNDMQKIIQKYGTAGVDAEIHFTAVV